MKKAFMIICCLLAVVGCGQKKVHKVFNCPALYTQCKTIRGTWKGLK